MTSAGSLNNLGTELHNAGDHAGAKTYYDAALRLEPYNFQALMNLVDIYSRTNQLSAACACASRATAIAPNKPDTWNRYGNILFRLERYKEAEDALKQALVLGSDNISTWHNLLLLNVRIHKFTDALHCYERLDALGAVNPAIQNDLAHVYLGMGELEKAYEPYEARWHSLQHLEPWDLHLPEWTGEHLLGKRILIHAEQGYGDSLMAVRFVPILLNYGAKITLALPPSLVRLFQMQPWDIEVVSIHEVEESWANRFDFHSPLYSMMRWLKINRGDIKSEAYLTVPELTVPNIHSESLNVGICWASGTRGTDMDFRRRVSPLEPWLKLIEVPGIHLWSLFPGTEAQNEIIKLGAESLVVDHVTRFEDFAETAAFIDQLDLVISVDTAMVHLAGALGKPVWMLSQFTPCWRWWNLKLCSGLPWYGEMRIFPQTKLGDWSTQLEVCQKELFYLAKDKLQIKPQSELAA